MSTPKYRPQAVHDSAQEAVEEAFKFGRALMLKGLKEREHRPRLEEKAEARFRRSVTVGDFVEFISDVMLEGSRVLEAEFGKPSREWSTEERRQAYDLVAEWFRRRTELCERPRGRPRKKRKIRSLIAGVVLSDAILPAMLEPGKRERKATREKLAKLVTCNLQYFSAEEPLKFGLIAGAIANRLQQKNTPEKEILEKLGTLSAARKYVEEKEAWDWNITVDSPMPAELLLELLEDEGLGPEHLPALKMRISRAKRSPRS